MSSPPTIDLQGVSVLFGMLGSAAGTPAGALGGTAPFALLLAATPDAVVVANGVVAGSDVPVPALPIGKTRGKAIVPGTETDPAPLPVGMVPPLPVAAPQAPAAVEASPPPTPSPAPADMPPIPTAPTARAAAPDPTAEGELRTVPMPMPTPATAMATPTPAKATPTPAMATVPVGAPRSVPNPATGHETSGEASVPQESAPPLPAPRIVASPRAAPLVDPEPMMAPRPVADADTAPVPVAPDARPGVTAPMPAASKPATPAEIAGTPEAIVPSAAPDTAPPRAETSVDDEPGTDKRLATATALPLETPAPAPAAKSIQAPRRTAPVVGATMEPTARAVAAPHDRQPIASVDTPTIDRPEMLPLGTPFARAMPIQGAPATELTFEDAVELDATSSGVNPVGRSPETPAPRPVQAAQAYRPNLPEMPSTERIAIAMQHAAAQGSDRIQIQLWPEHLGRVDVLLDVKDGNQVQATVTADRPGTYELLQRDAKGLERALELAGLKVAAGDLSFSWRQGGQQDPSFGQGSSRGKPWNGRDLPPTIDDVIAATSVAWRDPSRLIDLSA